MFWSFFYVVLQRLLQLAALRLRSDHFKELEIVVLRHELAVLRRQAGRPKLRTADRVFLAAANQLLPRSSSADWGRDQKLVLRFARENPRWGYLRITGELRGLGFTVSATTVCKLLREAGLEPAGKRAGLSWRELRTQAQSMIAVDFFTVETLRLQRLYVLFFIELGSRRVHLAGCTGQPTQRLGESTGPSARLDGNRTLDHAAVPGPRSRQQVHP